MPSTRPRARSRNLDIDSHRLRLALTVYDPATRTYRSSTDLSVRLSVASQSEIRALWRTIVEVVEGRRDYATPSAGDGRHSDPTRALLAVRPE